MGGAELRLRDSAIFCHVQERPKKRYFRAKNQQKSPFRNGREALRSRCPGQGRMLSMALQRKQRYRSNGRPT